MASARGGQTFTVEGRNLLDVAGVRFFSSERGWTEEVSVLDDGNLTFVSSDARDLLDPQADGSA